MAAFDELAALAAHLSDASVDALAGALQDPDRRWFFAGQGRSGLVAAMVAMRFMHLGWRSHVVGEATAPAVRAGDGLLVISGSGSTPASVSWASRARAEGATVAAVTHTDPSPIVQLADVVLRLPAQPSTQLGGSLFEQAALLVLDGIVTTLARRLEDPHGGLARRHANLQ